MSINLAISGAGWISDWYYKAYQKLTEDFELKGCCGNPSPEGIKRLSDKCSSWGVRSFTSFNEVVNDPDIDAVAVFSPTSLHYDQAMQAMEKGKHVLVEKPVALDSSELKKLENSARANGVVLFPGHNFVYRPVIRKAKEIIESGVLGKISYASFRACHFIPPEHAAGWRKDFSKAGGGAMMDSGTHLVYQMFYLMGSPDYLSCFSATNHYTQMDGEDTCLISLEFPGGAMGQVFQSWSSADGSAGEIRVQGDKGNLLLTDVLSLNGEVVETDSGYEESFYHTLKAFGDAVTAGTAPLSPVSEAEKTLRLIQEAYLSAESRKTLKWND